MIIKLLKQIKFKRYKIIHKVYNFDLIIRYKKHISFYEFLSSKTLETQLILSLKDFLN